jgi:hypothetical protein
MKAEAFRLLQPQLEVIGARVPCDAYRLRD